MTGLDENIKRVNAKLQLLLKRYQQLQKDNIRLNDTVKQLTDNREKNEKQIAELQQQASILKAGAGSMKEADKQEFEKQINKYIREVDKCIAMLSE